MTALFIQKGESYVVVPFVIDLFYMHCSSRHTRVGLQKAMLVWIEADICIYTKSHLLPGGVCWGLLTGILANTASEQPVW